MMCMWRGVRRTDSPATRSDWLCALMTMWLYAISLVAKTCGSSFVQLAPCTHRGGGAGLGGSG